LHGQAVTTARGPNRAPPFVVRPVKAWHRPLARLVNMPYPVLRLTKAMASSLALAAGAGLLAVDVVSDAFTVAGATAVAGWTGRCAAPQPKTTVVASSTSANRGAAAGD